MMRFAVLAFVLLAAACAQPESPTISAPAAKPPVAQPTPTPAAKTPPANAARAPWKPVKVVADAVDVPAQRVTVKPGDTVSRIGERTGSSVQAIAQANKLPPPYVIAAGQVLSIPAGRYHTMKPGETGIAVARAYGVDWAKVVAVNELKSPYVLRVGQRLRLPTKAATRQLTMAERAAAFTVDINDLISGGEPAVAASAPAAAPAVDPAAAQPPATQTAAAAPLPPPPAFNGRFIAPLNGRVISRFGPKDDGLRNDGINIKASMGTPIRAAADGVVAYAGDGIESFGNLVLIKHAGGWVTAYAHAEDLLVIRGDTVRQGDPIARVGKSGSVDEPQLHFEIRQGRRPIDPARELPPAS